MPPDEHLGRAGGRVSRHPGPDHRAARGLCDAFNLILALLKPPGFLMLNYGPSTLIVTLAAHLAYGTIIGGFLAWPD